MKLLLNSLLVFSLSLCMCRAGEKIEAKPHISKVRLFYVFEGKTEIIENIKVFVLNTLQNQDPGIVFRGAGEILANEMSEMQRLIDIKSGLKNTYLEFSDPKSRSVKVLIIASELSLEEKTSYFTLIMYPELDKNSSEAVARHLSDYAKLGKITNLEKVDRQKLKP